MWLPVVRGYSVWRVVSVSPPERPVSMMNEHDRRRLAGLPCDGGQSGDLLVDRVPVRIAIQHCDVDRTDLCEDINPTRTVQRYLLVARRHLDQICARRRVDGVQRVQGSAGGLKQPPTKTPLAGTHLDDCARLRRYKDRRDRGRKAAVHELSLRSPARLVRRVVLVARRYVPLAPDTQMAHASEARMSDLARKAAACSEPDERARRSPPAQQAGGNLWGQLVDDRQPREWIRRGGPAGIAHHEPATWFEYAMEVSQRTTTIGTPLQVAEGVIDHDEVKGLVVLDEIIHPPALEGGVETETPRDRSPNLGPRSVRVHPNDRCTGRREIEAQGAEPTAEIRDAEPIQLRRSTAASQNVDEQGPSRWSKRGVGVQCPQPRITCQALASRAVKIDDLVAERESDLREVRIERCRRMLRQ